MKAIIKNNHIFFRSIIVVIWVGVLIVIKIEKHLHLTVYLFYTYFKTCLT